MSRLLVSLLLALAARAASTGSTGLIRCPRDAQLNQCTGKAFERIINSMQTGDPSHGIPNLEPLLIPFLDVSKNAGSVLNLKLYFTNMSVTDVFKDVVVNSARFDPLKLDLSMELFRPVLESRGRYVMAGKIFWLPVWGSGTFFLRMTNVYEHFRLVGKADLVSGQRVWVVQHHSSRLDPQGMTIQFDNLFNGNTVLGSSANALINRRWRLLYEQLGPFVDAKLSSIMQPHWKSILLRTPLSEEFPPV